MHNLTGADVARLVSSLLNLDAESVEVFRSACPVCKAVGRGEPR